MRNILLVALILTGIFQTAAASDFKCPAGEKLAWGITTAKPKNAEDLHSLSVTPPIYGTPDEWELDLVSNHSKQKLYLSCAYKNSTIFSKLLPSKVQNCTTVGYNKDLSVSCRNRR